MGLVDGESLGEIIEEGAACAVPVRRVGDISSLRPARWRRHLEPRPFASLDTRRWRLSHRLSDEMHPVPDTNVVLAVERRQFAMAGMKDRANSVTAVRGGSAPSTASGGGKRAGNRGKRAAHMAGMGRPFDQFEPCNSREHADNATIDGDMRSEAHVPMQENPPVHGNVHDGREPFAPI
jgi:hypothetical protein